MNWLIDGAYGDLYRRAMNIGPLGLARVTPTFVVKELPGK